MVNIQEIIRQLTANAKAISALVQSFSEEQAQWKPNPETWSMREVMEHVYNEERTDFRKHLKEMLKDPHQPWGGGKPEAYISVDGCRQALENFLTERQASIAWLIVLKSLDWNVSLQAPYGPKGKMMIISAGDVLVSWVAHDYLHLRQLNELLYAWNKTHASPYSVKYAGRW